MIRQPKVVQVIYKVPVVLVGFLGALYAVVLILRFREDTTLITNAAFAIMATLAALSFSFARVIETDQLRDRVMFAGERLLHGAVLVLVASILKYSMFLSFKISALAASPLVETAITYTLGLLTAVIFANGVLFAHTGLRVLNDLLLLRFTRHKDWDDIW